MIEVYDYGCKPPKLFHSGVAQQARARTEHAERRRQVARVSDIEAKVLLEVRRQCVVERELRHRGHSESPGM